MGSQSHLAQVTQAQESGHAYVHDIYMAVLHNAISYTAAFSAWERGQRWQQAWSLWAVTQQTAVLPNAISYKADFSACVKGQQCQRRQQTAGLPNVISYSAAISPFEKGQQWQQVAGLRNAISYTQLPSVLVKRASNGSRSWVFGQ